MMNRRRFVALLAAASSFPATSARGREVFPEVGLTFDDPTSDGDALFSWQKVNSCILSALASRNLKTVLFVCGKRVDSNAGNQLVAQWANEGHAIANHSYSHLNFNTSVTLDQFKSDAVRVEPLIHGYARFVRLFRFPFFKEGDTLEKRDGMRSFLKKHGYRLGRATIDASDWAIDMRLNERAKQSPKPNFSNYRDFYLHHIWERAEFYNSLALRVLGRPVRHTLLLHHNALNALFLKDLLQMFVDKGWKLIDAQAAYRDPAYDLQPKILPAGESLIWALAKETGRFDNELRYPGEDDVYENPKMDALHL